MATDIAVLPGSKDLAEYRGQVTAVQRIANDFVVDGKASVELGEQVLRNIKGVEESIVERRTEITRPLMGSLASVRELFKPFEAALADAKKTVKGKLLDYTLAQEEIQRLAQEKIEARLAKGAIRADTAVAKLESLNDSKVKTNTRTVRKLSITDESMLPREFLVPNREAITKALFEGLSVPGAKLVSEKVLVTR